jgi:poly(3-hydroxybutyrate) depolymerase
MRRAAFLALAVALLARPAAGAPPDRESLLDAMRRVVGLSTRRERASAAQALAAKPDADVDAWLDALAAFPPTDTPSEARGEAIVDLPIGDGKESTTIAWRTPKGWQRGKPAPLLLGFHSSDGDGHETDGQWGEVADALGMIVVGPYDPTGVRGYHFLPRERDQALETLRWARRRFDVDENRVYVTGVSRGGHMTWDVALRFPTPFAAVVPFLGAPRIAGQKSGTNNLRFVENVARLGVRDLQGAQDDPKAVANVRLAFERLKGFGAADARLVESPALAHAYEFGAVDWKEFLGASKRDPLAGRVVRRAAGREEARSLWAEILDTDASLVVEDVPALVPPSVKGEEAQRAWYTAEVDRHTARLEVQRKAPGRFEANSVGVKRFRLLLSKAMLDGTKAVTVVWNGKTVSKGVAPSKAVLLADFAERFDRTYLPVVEVVVP